MIISFIKELGALIKKKHIPKKNFLPDVEETVGHMSDVCNMFAFCNMSADCFTASNMYSVPCMPVK